MGLASAAARGVTGAPSPMRQRLSALLRIAANERQMFVVVNVLVNLFLLARSYLTMQVLDYRELGLAALLQSIVLLLGALQLGFLNGGFRLMCAAEGDEAQRINNLIYTFLGALGLVSLAVAGGSLLLIAGADSDAVALLGVVGGIATLGRTWMTNQMVAHGKLARLNRINLLAGAASLAALAFIPVNPLGACLAAVVAQPVMFVIAAGLRDRALLPDRPLFDLALVRRVLATGFVVFLTGMFLQANLQLERWYVTGFLGLEALGHLYLAILFVTLFQMVPTSLDQLFLPPMVRAHERADSAALRHSMLRFVLVTVLYCAAAVVAVAVLARPVVDLLLPRYVPDLRYVYLVLPGLVLFTLAGPFSVIFNVLIRYRYYLIAYGGGTAVTALLFLAASLRPGGIGLDGVIVIRSAVYAGMAAVLLFGFWRLSRGLPAWRLPRRVPAGDPA
ncbi:lipopolysaccharide biosynthesis protein [Sphingomonas koreensis]